MLPPLLFRPARPEDEAFIMSAWLNCHLEDGDWPRRIHRERYFEHHRLIVMGTLSRARTVVACNQERESQLLGFVCHEGRRLHWIYVKDLVRGLGLGSLLIAAAKDPDIATHWTRNASAWLARKGVRYDPFALEL